jgi:hypothetical protein
MGWRPDTKVETYKGSVALSSTSGETIMDPLEESFEAVLCTFPTRLFEHSAGSLEYKRSLLVLFPINGEIIFFRI